MGEEMKQNLHLVYVHKNKSAYCEISTQFHCSS